MALTTFNNPLRFTLKLLIVFSIIITNGCNNDDSEPVDPDIEEDTILVEIIDIAETNSINRLTIDWDELREEVMGLSASSGDRSAAISRFLTLLGDNHSFYIEADNTYIFAERYDFQCSVTNVSISASPDEYGYVQVPTFVGTTQEADELANDLQSSIADQAETHPSKWVVDLTENGGGNMYPMIAGLGPFFGNGILGYFIDPLGQAVAWGYSNGGSWIGSDTQVITSVEEPFRFENDPKVAVVFDNSTGSSGEATLISFIGRPNTKTFGIESCGLSTANAGFAISNGDQLILTVSDMADRDRNIFGSQVIPDETFDDSESLKERVIEWLNE